MYLTDNILAEALAGRFNFDPNDVSKYDIMLAPYDEQLKTQWIQNGRNPDNYVPAYEPFRVRSGAVLYDRIRWKSIRIDNNKKYMTFLTDDDTVSNYACSNRILTGYIDKSQPGLVSGEVVRMVWLDFTQITAIETTILVK